MHRASGVGDAMFQDDQEKDERVRYCSLVFIAFFLSGWVAGAQPHEILRLDAGKAPSKTGPVVSWPDSSGQCNDAAQSDPERQPARADSGGVRFEGNDYLTTPVKRDWSGTDWTLFAVASLDADVQANYRGIIGNRFGEGRANWWSLGTKGDGTLYLELAAGVGVNTSIRLADSRAYVYAVTKQGENFSLYRNGVLAGKAAHAAVGGMDNELRIGMWFGEGQEWDGDIAEILLCDGALPDAERARIEGELAEKWNVFFAQKRYVKADTWESTMLAARKVLSGCPGGAGEMWDLIRADFPEACAHFERDAAAAGRAPLEWFSAPGDATFERAVIALAGPRFTARAESLAASAAPEDPKWLALCREAGETRDAFLSEQSRLGKVNLEALGRAIADLSAAYPATYANGPELLRRCEDWARRLPEIPTGLAQCDEAALASAKELHAFQREALLANPLLDFDRLLYVRRGAGSPSLGLVQNWQSNCMLPHTGFDDAIMSLPVATPEGDATVLYKPEQPVFVGDVDLHFDADRMLFSSIGSNDRWQIFEIGTDGTGLRQVTPGDEPDVDNYDACYLPDGRIIFGSNAYFAAVPCVNGSTRTATLYRMNADGSDIRQLCFDQEHNWCPTMLPNGRVLYLRWEYTDTPHSHDRVLFRMNPDGTGQMAYYGSNSYWPNSLFYARPVPGCPSKFVGIVSGHHGVPRMGELVLFDTALGRQEAEGAVQRIPGFGQKVQTPDDLRYDSPLTMDQLVDASWPKFLHPYPLSDKYFLVSCKPSPDSLWGLYLVDVFDNMLLLREEPGCALFEPVPVRKTPAPPIIPDRVDPQREDALVYLTDVHFGGGLRGIPRGEVKALRLFTYHFLYPGMGGPQAVVGMEGPWDMRRTLGTVPVEEDGSAYFRVPANTPIAVQPLDAEGKALQLMRSWFTGMRGEVLSCVGCHESQNSTPPAKATLASRRAPSEIALWHGPERGYNYDRELQPVLDQYCVGCHNGAARAGGQQIPNLQDRTHITDYTSVFHHGGQDAGHFSKSYVALHRFVRRPGLESDYHLLTPMEFHADSTDLIQMLQKGHHNVRLDAEAWDRLITWVDLNAPFHGTWTEIAGGQRVAYPEKRRRELLRRYANMNTAPEAIPPASSASVAPVMPEPEPETAPAPAVCEGWPFGREEAERRQAALGATQRTVDVGSGVTMTLMRIPAGAFVMGDVEGLADERPASTVGIDTPFWMGACEVTNAQFAQYDPAHDSAVESRFSMQFGVRGFFVNGPEQPVVRVSWSQAMAFCAWLSEKTGLRFSLPTEAQWEYACRAGAATPFFFGEIDADWTGYANFADEKLREFVCHTYKKEREPWLNASQYDDWIPKDTRFNDGGFLSDGTGMYQPNAWGLYDMHGNVCEWTRSDYKVYPYADDGRNAGAEGEKKVARGGSWRDRPQHATASYRLAYRPYQPVYNVGFRVICESVE